jgi:hypothetical protein
MPAGPSEVVCTVVDDALSDSISSLESFASSGSQHEHITTSRDPKINNLRKLCNNGKPKSRRVVPHRRRNCTFPVTGKKPNRDRGGSGRGYFDIESQKNSLDDSQHSLNSIDFQQMLQKEVKGYNHDSSRWGSSSQLHNTTQGISSNDGAASDSCRWQDSMATLDSGMVGSKSIGFNDSKSSRWSASMTSFTSEQLSIGLRAPVRQRSSKSVTSSKNTPAAGTSNANVTGKTDESCLTEPEGTEDIGRISAKSSAAVKPKPRQRLPNRQKSFGRVKNLSNTASVLLAKQECWKKQNSQRSLAAEGL